jgi:hypothetical protein
MFTRRLLFAVVAFATFAMAVLAPTGASAWDSRGGGFGRGGWGHFNHLNQRCDPYKCYGKGG